MDVAALFPLTCAHLEGRAPSAATPEAFVEAVCAAHPKGDIPSRAVRDLARYEATLLELRAARDPGPPGAIPRDDERCRLAPHVRVLIYGADLPGVLAALREGRRPAPRPARGWLVTVREGEGRLREFVLHREDGWVLERFRDPALPGEALDDEERDSFARIWGAGILRRA